MIEIIAGTDRPGSNTLKVANSLLQLYRELGIEADLIDVGQLRLSDVDGGVYYQGAKGSFKDAVARVTKADGLLVVVPEYNGSFPGALKLFIDYWHYPKTFENRPIALVGLGGRWGGLRPVEHLQQVFGYRNAFIFPSRVFLTNVKDAFKDGQIADSLVKDLMRTQALDFQKFIRGLQDQRLDANSRLAANPS